MSAVNVSGTVCSPARAICTRSGAWFLRVDLALPKNGAVSAGTVAIRKDFGTGEAAAVACQTRAKQLRHGVRMTVQAPSATGRISLSGPIELALPDLYDHHQKVCP